jgi:hypothetical protein
VNAAVTTAILAGREFIPVACPCEWDDGGELHVVDIRHPDGFAVTPPSSHSPLVVYGDEGECLEQTECASCGLTITHRTVVQREAVTR